MATLPQWIEARVIQKIATEAEWNEITLVPYKGEVCLVGDSGGKVVNIKVGDGINTFPNLEYMFDSIQQNVGYIAIESNALPTPLDDVAWGMVTGGTYTFGGVDAFTVPAGHWGIANYSSGSWSLVDMGELPTVDVADYVVEGGSEATSQDAVFKNNTRVSVGNAANPANIESGLINSAGAFTSGATWKRIKNIPAYNEVPMTITGVRASGSKRIALYSDINGAGFISIVGTVSATNTFTPTGLPPNGGYLAVTIKTDSEADDTIAFPNLQIEYKSEPTDYKPYSPELKVILSSQTPIEASYVKEGAKIGGEDIATEEYVSEVAVTNDDLDVQGSVNLANPDKRVIGQFIDSSGNKLTGSGWSMIEIDTSGYPVGQKITVSNMVITAGHAAWYNGSTKVAYAGVYTTSTLPVTFEKPSDGNSLWIDDMRSSIENPNIMVNLGDTALPFEPYHPPRLVKIKGYSIEASGGEAYDQSLNTFDSVSFAFIQAAGIRFPLPEGNGTPPEGVLIGDAWIDTTDDTIKVRRS